MARPTKNKETRRRSRGIAFNDQEWAELRAAADEAGVPVADYVLGSHRGEAHTPEVLRKLDLILERLPAKGGAGPA